MADDTMFVRRYRPEDIHDVRRVCFETGLMGDPIVEQFSDRRTFADMFCDWFVLNRPDTCWVLDDGRGAAIGYLLASPDTPDRSAYERRILTHHLLGRGVILRPGTMRFFVRAVRDLSRDRRAIDAPWDLERFPAEIHINLLPDGRGGGFGSQLMEAALADLRERGVPGVHLSTFGENHGAMAFFRAQGFEDSPFGPASSRDGADAVTNPGFRSPEGSRLTVRRFCMEVA